MNDTEFNLLDEPWIRVMSEDCKVSEVSLIDALVNAHKYKKLCGELPTQDVAMLRLMLAVLHTVFSRVDVDGEESPIEDEEDAVERWKSLWELGAIPEKPIREYFEKWHERFWLFHPERPFGQVAELKSGTEYGASKLNGEISESNNKMRFFSSFYGEEKESLTYSQAARWLIYLNAFDDASSFNHRHTDDGECRYKEGTIPSIGVGWLGQLGIVYLCGNNLFETLLLNLVMINNGNVESNELPAWENDKISAVERVQLPPPKSLAELYTLQSRRVLLKRQSGMVTGCMLYGGDCYNKENGFFEPMTVWSEPAKKTGIIYPLTHDITKQMWREFAFYFCDNARNRPGVVSWFQDYVGGFCKLPMMNAAIASVQYVPGQNSSVIDIFSDSLSMHANILLNVGRNLRSDIESEIEKCEKLANAVYRYACNLYVASGGSTNGCDNAGKNAKEQFYYRLDMPFRKWLRCLDPDDFEESQKLFLEWQDTAKGIALKYAEEMAADSGDYAVVGHFVEIKDKSGKLEKKLYSTPKALKDLRDDINKIYKKV